MANMFDKITGATTFEHLVMKFNQALDQSVEVGKVVVESHNDICQSTLCEIAIVRSIYCVMLIPSIRCEQLCFANRNSNF